MTLTKKIIRQQQCIARMEQSAALEKIRKRRAETRQKIQWGGLVIKAGMSGYDKAVILGALLHAHELLQDQDYTNLFHLKGQQEFLKESTSP